MLIGDSSSTLLMETGLLHDYFGNNSMQGEDGRDARLVGGGQEGGARWG